MAAQRTILVCPLDWGLGHATRCIPIIHHCVDNGWEVVIVGYGQSLQLLKQEFPSLRFVTLEGFSASYSSSKLLWLKLFLQLPQFIYHKHKEHRQLKRLVKLFNPRLIVSDNRYGLHHRKVESVIITHQLNPQSPKPLRFLNPIISAVIARWVTRFDQCWVPDFEGLKSLAGKLSENTRNIAHVRYIGPLTRFSTDGLNLPVPLNHAMAQPSVAKTLPSLKTIPISTIGIDLSRPYILAVVSGPEPQRTLFSDLMKAQLSRLPHQSLLVEGKPSAPFFATPLNHLTIVPHLDTDTLETLIRRSRMIVCRSGYSSVMDLHHLHAKAILVATSGQTEQEYLSNHLHNNHLFFKVEQSSFDISKAMFEADKFYNG